MKAIIIILKLFLCISLFHNNNNKCIGEISIFFWYYNAFLKQYALSIRVQEF